jgi:hypothetical protein
MRPSRSRTSRGSFTALQLPEATPVVIENTGQMNDTPELVVQNVVAVRSEIR